MNGPHTAMTKIEAMVQPNRVGDDFFWVSVTLVCIHPSILPFHDSLLGNTVVTSILNTRFNRCKL